MSAQPLIKENRFSVWTIEATNLCCDWKKSAWGRVKNGTWMSRAFYLCRSKTNNKHVGSGWGNNTIWHNKGLWFDLISVDSWGEKTGRMGKYPKTSMTPKLISVQSAASRCSMRNNIRLHMSSATPMSSTSFISEESVRPRQHNFRAISTLHSKLPFWTTGTAGSSAAMIGCFPQSLAGVVHLPLPNYRAVYSSRLWQSSPSASCHSSEELALLQQPTHQIRVAVPAARNQIGEEVCLCLVSDGQFNLHKSSESKYILN